MNFSNRLYVKGPDGKPWGYIQDRVYFRYGHDKMKKLDAWGIDADKFDKMIRAACHSIVVTDKGGRRYKISVADFDKFKGELPDYKHGRQYFVMSEYWTKLSERGIYA